MQNLSQNARLLLNQISTCETWAFPSPPNTSNSSTDYCRPKTPDQFQALSPRPHPQNNNTFDPITFRDETCL